jgi:hypothetical protein
MTGADTISDATIAGIAKVRMRNSFRWFDRDETYGRKMVRRRSLCGRSMKMAW